MYLQSLCILFETCNGVSIPANDSQSRFTYKLSRDSLRFWPFDVPLEFMTSCTFKSRSSSRSLTSPRACFSVSSSRLFSSCSHDQPEVCTTVMRYVFVRTFIFLFSFVSSRHSFSSLSFNVLVLLFSDLLYRPLSVTSLLVSCSWHDLVPVFSYPPAARSTSSGQFRSY